MTGFLSRTTRSGLVSLGFALLTVAGCSALPVSNSPLHAAEEPIHLSPSERSQLMYEVMIAELAGRRGYLDIATEGYNAAAMRTSDPRISERATKLAVFSRNWSQAKIAGKRWGQLDPGNPDVYQLLSQVFLRQGDASGAADQMQALIDVSEAPLGSSIEDVYLSLSREPDVKTALATMEFVRDRYPEEVAAHMGLSRLALTAGARDQSLAAVEKAIELDPGNSEALLTRAQVLMSVGKGSDGIGDLQKAVEANPEDVGLHTGFARLLVDAGRYDEAAVELDSLFEKAPENPQTVFTIGLLALESKRNDAARRYLTQLLELGEYESEAHYYLARIADSQQDYPLAIEHYEQVVAGDSFIDAHIRAAELYGLTDRIEEGREQLRRLGESNADPALQPRLMRAEARLLRRADRGREAIVVLTEGLKKYPDNGELLYARALFAEGEGDAGMFEADLRHLIKIEPDNAHALNALGYYFVDNNIKLEEAEPMLVKANELLPDDAAILDSVGWLYYRLGKTEKALGYLREAYEQMQDAEIAAHLGEVLWVSGEEDNAKEIWDRALAESPDDAKLKSVVERFVQ